MNAKTQHKKVTHLITHLKFQVGKIFSVKWVTL